MTVGHRHLGTIVQDLFQSAVRVEIGALVGDLSLAPSWRIAMLKVHSAIVLEPGRIQFALVTRRSAT